MSSAKRKFVIVLPPILTGMSPYVILPRPLAQEEDDLTARTMMAHYY